MTIQQFMHALFEGYRRADSDAIAACHALPCVMATVAGQRVFDDPDELRAHCQRQIEELADRTLRVERHTIRSLLILGDDFAVAHVVWAMLSPRKGMTTHAVAYNLRRDAGQWTIWAVSDYEKGA